MILSDRAIREAIAKGEIVVDPFDLRRLGTNSYDVRLAPTLLTYRTGWSLDGALDCKALPETEEWQIPPDGTVLRPGVLYLGVTEEYTESRAHVPFLDGKSSVGRLGVFIHATAGRGDVGFRGHWTLEISVVQPVRVYAGMPIGQLIWFETTPVDVPYDRKSSRKYDAPGRRDKPVPAPSRMHLNFEGGEGGGR